MGDTLTTRTDEPTVDHIEDMPAVPVLVVVHHPDADRIGRRFVLAANEDLVLGRSAEIFGPGALELSSVSRNHAVLRTTLEGSQLRDSGSHNGTFVNGTAVSTHSLQPGDVVGLGPVLLLYGLGHIIARRPDSHRLLGVSGALWTVVEQVKRAAPEDAPVLIQGETGVGKELVATELHGLSGRAGQLVAVNCGGLTDGVVHSELFGHARGAFSGADRRRDGLVAAAAGGTLFLDEIGDASPALQASLLRLLETAQYRPVGSDQTRSADVRFVAATHVSLQDAVVAGQFRHDLFARLNRWMIRMPPLRDRIEDAVPLAHHFATQSGVAAPRLSRSLALALLRHPWPHNVRELRAVTERAVAESHGGSVLQLCPAVRDMLGEAATMAVGEGRAAEAPATEPAAPVPARRQGRPKRPSDGELHALAEQERGNVRAMADRLGVARNTVYSWLSSAGIDVQAFRG